MAYLPFQAYANYGTWSIDIELNVKIANLFLSLKNVIKAEKRSQLIILIWYSNNNIYHIEYIHNLFTRISEARVFR